MLALSLAITALRRRLTAPPIVGPVPGQIDLSNGAASGLALALHVI